MELAAEVAEAAKPDKILIQEGPSAQYSWTKQSPLAKQRKQTLMYENDFVWPRLMKPFFVRGTGKPRDEPNTWGTQDA